MTLDAAWGLETPAPLPLCHGRGQQAGDSRRGTAGGGPGGAAPRKWTRHCAAEVDGAGPAARRRWLRACSEVLARPPRARGAPCLWARLSETPPVTGRGFPLEPSHHSRLLSRFPKCPRGDVKAAARTVTCTDQQQRLGKAARSSKECAERQTPARTGARKPEGRHPGDPTQRSSARSAPSRCSS